MFPSVTRRASQNSANLPISLLYIKVEQCEIVSICNTVSYGIYSRVATRSEIGDVSRGNDKEANELTDMFATVGHLIVKYSIKTRTVFQVYKCLIQFDYLLVLEPYFCSRTDQFLIMKIPQIPIPLSDQCRFSCSRVRIARVKHLPHRLGPHDRSIGRQPKSASFNCSSARQENTYLIALTLRGEPIIRHSDGLIHNGSFIAS